jgi:hypothetical protein
MRILMSRFDGSISKMGARRLSTSLETGSRNMSFEIGGGGGGRPMSLWVQELQFADWRRTPFFASILVRIDARVARRTLFLLSILCGG